MTILDTVLSVAAVGATSFLAIQGLHYNSARKALDRRASWYERQSEALGHMIGEYRELIYAHSARATDVGEPSIRNQICGGCGAFLTQEEIINCRGEKCERYLQTFVLSDTK